jgi:hypothetical protein
MVAWGSACSKSLGLASNACLPTLSACPPCLPAHPACLPLQDVVSYDPLAAACRSGVLQEDGSLKPMVAMLLSRPGLRLMTRYAFGPV